MIQLWALCHDEQIDTLANIDIKRIINTAKTNQINFQFIRGNSVFVWFDKGQMKLHIGKKLVGLPHIILNCLESTRQNNELLSTFKSMNIPILPNLDGMNLANNKWYSHLVMMKAKLPTPATSLILPHTDLTVVSEYLSYPFVLKQIYGAFGEGVYLVHEKNELENMLRMYYMNPEAQPLIAQEYISHNPGEDIRVFIINDKVVASIKRKALGSEFRANIALGAQTLAYTLPQKIERIAIDAVRAHRLSYGGVDLLESKDGYVICEVNSRPLFQGIESSYDIDLVELLSKHILEIVQS